MFLVIIYLLNNFTVFRIKINLCLRQRGMSAASGDSDRKVNSGEEGNCFVDYDYRIVS